MFFRNKEIKEPFSSAEKAKITAAIEAAEKSTSGEIRVHVDLSCSKDPVERAVECFDKMGMSATELRNGVLVYIAIKERSFAIIGDQGINEKVPAGFWDSTRDLMLSHFKNNQLVDGLCAGIQHAGEQLKTHFPLADDDSNELSNDISFGDGK